MKSIVIMLVVFCTLLGSAGSAHAYLDPGAGSMILQVLLGGLAGLAVILKLYWHQLLAFLGIRKVESEGEKVQNEIAEEVK